MVDDWYENCHEHEHEHEHLNQVHLRVCFVWIAMFANAYPEGVTVRTTRGSLPIHFLIGRSHRDGGTPDMQCLLMLLQESGYAGLFVPFSTDFR